MFVLLAQELLNNSFIEGTQNLFFCIICYEYQYVWANFAPNSGCFRYIYTGNCIYTVPCRNHNMKFKLFCYLRCKVCRKVLEALRMRKWEIDSSASMVCISTKQLLHQKSLLHDCLAPSLGVFASYLNRIDLIHAEHVHACSAEFLFWGKSSGVP